MITLDFVLRQGEFELEIHERIDVRVTALFGPSGAGKTTVLDAIAGLRTPAHGTIAVGERQLFSSGEAGSRGAGEAGSRGAGGPGSRGAGEPGGRTINLPPHQRHVGYVTQDVALFPHLNVRRNVLYGQRHGQKLDLTTVAGMLEVGSLLDRHVHQLSGGEKQRVALARALMSAPSVLLLDEPLAAVDVERRRRILPYLERVRDQLAVPIIYVTHDQEELRRIADRVITLADGRVTT